MKNLHTTFLLHSFIIHLDVATGSKGDKDVHPLWLRHSIYGIYIEYMHKIPQKQRDLHKNFDMFHSTKKKKMKMIIIIRQQIKLAYVRIT